MRRFAFACALFALPAFAAAPARAIEIDPYLPSETEAVVSVNIQQILGSPLVKKYFQDKIEKAIAGNAEMQQATKALGLDPLKDVHRITVAGSSGASEQGFVIVSGKFDPAKINAVAAEVAKQQGEKLKIVQEGGATLYEVKGGGNDMYLHVLDDRTILAATGTKAIKDALAKKAAAKKPLVKPSMKALLEKADEKASIYMVALNSGNANQNLPIPIDPNVKQTLDKIVALSGAITVTADVKMEIGLQIKDEDSAKDLGKTIEEGLQQVKAIAPLLAAQQKELAPVVELLNSIKSSQSAKTVTIKGEVPADLIEKAMKGGAGQ